MVAIREKCYFCETESQGGRPPTKRCCRTTSNNTLSTMLRMVPVGARR
jgi:hypothetical protein